MNGKTQVIVLTIIWAITTAVGVALSLSVGLFPSPASGEAQIIDSAMTLLTVLSVPIFTLVVVLMVYSMARFRHRGDVAEDGPPIHGNMKVEVVWVVITTALVLFLAGYGTLGLLDIRSHAVHAAHPQGELVVQAQGSQWFWEFYYPEQKVRTKDQEELFLPVGRPVRFEVTAADVIHSFWVPAFRMKIDAVPGMVTTVYATPDKTGTFKEDYHLRVQCAELCGLGHGKMATPIVVVETSQFDAWVAQRTRTN